MLSLIAFHALYGLSLPISKTLLQCSSPLLLTTLRMMGGGLLVCIPLFLWDRSMLTITKERLITYSTIAFFLVYLKYILRYISLKHLSVAKIAFIMACTPFVAALFEYFLHKKKLSRMQWLSLGLGFLGVMPLLIMTGPGEFQLEECMMISWAELAILGSMLAHIYGMTLVSKVMRTHTIKPVILNGMTTLLGGVFACITFMCTESLPSADQVLPMISGVLVLIILSNIICHTFYMHLTRLYSITFITFTDFLSTLFSAFYGWFFLHEPYNNYYLPSAIIIVFALWLFYKNEITITQCVEL